MPDPTQSPDPAQLPRRPLRPNPTSARPAPAGTKPARPRAAGEPGAAPAPPRPEVTEADRARGRIIGLALVGAAAIIAIVVTIGIFLPALGAMTRGGVRPVDAASLPDVITVCDREYTRTRDILLTPGEMRAAVPDAEPVVVGINGGCPANVCMRNGACLATVFVETTDGRYADYSAGDGPNP
ncbi:MAG TPA: hypothetical protein VFY23_17040 [Candidatus Limnocylindrales bacterium]|nr:hypothetical protein [Candidatus Limnocylindrales bacterium]